MSPIKIVSSMTLINDCHRRYGFHNFNYVISKFYHYIEFIKSSKYNQTINTKIQYLVFQKHNYYSNFELQNTTKFSSLFCTL